MPAKSGLAITKVLKPKESEDASATIAIDYPREEELVIPGHYAVRISAHPQAQVEISINEGDWLGCRHAVGYYWFDWEPSKAGEVTLVARQKIGKGRAKKSDTRFCRIVGKKA